MKTIPRPDIKDARKLTPMEMNNLHFKDAGKHTPVPADKKPSSPEQP